MEPKVMQGSDIATDSAKAALPIIGGVGLQWLHLADELLTIGTHAVGFCAAVCGLVWYVRRLRRDLKNNP